MRSPDSGLPAGGAPGDRRPAQEGAHAVYTPSGSWAMDAIHGHCRCSSNFSRTTRKASPSGWKPSGRSTRFRRTAQANWRRPMAMGTTSSRVAVDIAVNRDPGCWMRTCWQAFWREHSEQKPDRVPVRFDGRQRGSIPGGLFMARAAGAGVPVDRIGFPDRDIRVKILGWFSHYRDVTNRLAGFVLHGEAESAIPPFPAKLQNGDASLFEEKGPIFRQDGQRGRPARRRVPVLESSIAQNAGTGRQRRETMVQSHPEQKLEPDGFVPA